MTKPEKLAMRSPSLADENFSVLAKLFPNAVTETIDENGAIIRAIDADVLAQEINTHVVSGKEERYQFTWPDKKKSVLLANAPLAAALRPVREDEHAIMKVGDEEVPYTRTGSVDFDNTENLYIEGDNLDVLKLLRETYLNRVKMIYIDPPYNTGNDFIYEDDFAGDAGEFLTRDGQYDEDGNRMVKSLDSNGRFHTDWLNMMYPRLRLAKDLLADDGVIFISIDDNEAHNLYKICNEVFGQGNFIAQFQWKRRSGANDAKNNVSVDHEYILAYAKSPYFSLNGVIKEFGNYSNPDNDPRGAWARDNLTCGKTASQRPNLFYPIIDPKTGITYHANPDHVWRFEKNRMEELIKENKVIFPVDGKGLPTYKRHKAEVRSDTKPYSSIIDTRLNAVATKELRDLFGAQVFDYSKTVNLLYQLVSQATSRHNKDVILDFFSGSSTTAHAVMHLNAEDGGNRKFVMVQIPEPCPPDSEAAKASYSNICEIGKERIRRAGKKIKEDNKDKENIENLDIGFRVLKLDSSNMKDVYYTPEEYAKMNYDLLGFKDNIKEDRTAEDLLFQVMLELGVPLSAKIKQDGEVLYVNDNYLIACFGNIDTALITEIAKQKPYYAVFRDSSFIDDSAMVNFEQIFATYSPNTIRRVL